MAPPRRIRRHMRDGEKFSPWDYSSLLDLLDSLDVKRGHALPLLRSMASRVVASNVAPTWSELGYTEADLTDLGIPQKAASVFEKTVPFTALLETSKTSADGSTTKLVLKLRDERSIETVVMRHAHRTTVCVSSQVGCQMGCKFCATGTMPIVGDLTAGEIVEQLLQANMFEVAAGRQPIKCAVFMGMGEPLNNYDAMISALRTMTDVNQLGQYSLPPSCVTVSTVGVVPRMRQLARDAPKVSLALSLHAPNQALREKIVPSARHGPLDDLLQALDAHIAMATAHRAMVEYVLLAGVNDDDSCALELGHLMVPRAKHVMVNLIPYNPGASSNPEGYQAPTHARVERFQQIVSGCGVMARVRREMGRDIAGACGQLALAEGQGVASPSANVQDVEDFVAWQRTKAEKARQAASSSGPSSSSCSHESDSRLLVKVRQSLGPAQVVVLTTVAVTSFAIVFARFCRGSQPLRWLGVGKCVTHHVPR